MRINKVTYLKDFYIKNKQFIRPPKRGIKSITYIDEGKTGGTCCNESTPLENFWKFFNNKDRKVLTKLGLSTNADGYPRTFLKTSSDRPVSTSYVHDCSALYLYNDKTKTHTLYHAAPDTPKDELNLAIKILMNEGITHATIIPGASHFRFDHIWNIENMFELIKKYNPNTILNVKHSGSPFPEIVGYRGKVFEIPNKEISAQLAVYPERINKPFLLNDFGQASFKICDIDGYNTFDLIDEIESIKDIPKVKHKIKSANYPKETTNAFIRFINKIALLLTIQ